MNYAFINIQQERMFSIFTIFAKYKSNDKNFLMNSNDKNIALFVAFCIEEYGAAKDKSGEQVLDLFSKYGVIDYLSKCFETLHTQGREWLIAEIDEFIEIRKNIET